MKDDSFGAFLCACFGAILALVIVAITHDPCESHDAIIKAGHGEYVIVDLSTGRTEFRFKEIK